MPLLSNAAPNMFSSNLINAQRSQLVGGGSMMPYRGAGSGTGPGDKYSGVILGKGARLEFLGSVKVKDGLRLDGPIRAAFKVNKGHDVDRVVASCRVLALEL